MSADVSGLFGGLGMAMNTQHMAETETQPEPTSSPAVEAKAAPPALDTSIDTFVASRVDQFLAASSLSKDQRRLGDSVRRLEQLKQSLAAPKPEPTAEADPLTALMQSTPYKAAQKTFSLADMHTPRSSALVSEELRNCAVTRASAEEEAELRAEMAADFEAVSREMEAEMQQHQQHQQLQRPSSGRARKSLIVAGALAAGLLGGACVHQEEALSQWVATAGPAAREWVESAASLEASAEHLQALHDQAARFTASLSESLRAPVLAEAANAAVAACSRVEEWVASAAEMLPSASSLESHVMHAVVNGHLQLSSSILESYRRVYENVGGDKEYVDSPTAAMRSLMHQRSVVTEPSLETLIEQAPMDNENDVSIYYNAENDVSVYYDPASAPNSPLKTRVVAPTVEEEVEIPSQTGTTPTPESQTVETAPVAPAMLDTPASDMQALDDLLESILRD
jgi:hypothetical protein